LIRARLAHVNDMIRRDNPLLEGLEASLLSAIKVIGRVDGSARLVSDSALCNALTWSFHFRA